MTQESEKEERSLLAAEYVLGVLDSARRGEVERLAAKDPVLAAEIAYWEKTTAPLNASYEPVQPSHELYERIEGKIFGDRNPKPGLWNSLSFWRTAAFAASLAFIAVGSLAIWQINDNAGTQGQLVVSLVANDNSVSFVALYDADGFRLSPISGSPGPQKDFELWYLKGNEPPVSLGVLVQDAPTVVTLPPVIARNFDEGATLAISIEPKGGSPTGQATGPVVAVGQAKRI